MLGFGQAIMGAGGATGLSPTDVFEPALYTGTGAVRSVTTGINLTGAASGDLLQGGLVWIKGRGTNNHRLFDTVRGATNYIATDSPVAEGTSSASLTAFTSTGFSTGIDSGVNGNLQNYVAWTWRRAKTFFDVIAYTGNAANRTIAHGLTSTPGMLVVRRLDAGGECYVWHKGIAANTFLLLSDTAANAGAATFWNSTAPTSSVFSLGTNALVNASGGSFVAYLFGDTPGLCAAGTYAGSASAVTVTCGFAPRYVLVKGVSTVSNWVCSDTARGIVAGNDPYLIPNLINPEAVGVDWIDPLADGFTVTTALAAANTSGTNFIYYAVA